VLLIGLGAAGGLLIVPLNALLQHTGQQTVGSGSALALQNLFENSLMLISVTVYGMVMDHYPISHIMQAFALLILLSMIAIMLSARRHNN
jgi:LPLT family lysophospholipid transporter-like MFS transporter